MPRPLLKMHVVWRAVKHLADDALECAAVAVGLRHCRTEELRVEEASDREAMDEERLGRRESRGGQS